MAEIVNSSRQVTQIMGEVVQTSLAQSARLREVTDDLTAQDVSTTPGSGKPRPAVPLQASAREQAKVAIRNAAVSAY
jgi:methyl-accepting chemotaxis protein